MVVYISGWFPSLLPQIIQANSVSQPFRAELHIIPGADRKIMLEFHRYFLHFIIQMVYVFGCRFFIPYDGEVVQQRSKPGKGCCDFGNRHVLKNSFIRSSHAVLPVFFRSVQIVFIRLFYGVFKIIVGSIQTKVVGIMPKGFSR